MAQKSPIVESQDTLLLSPRSRIIITSRSMVLTWAEDEFTRRCSSRK